MKLVVVDASLAVKWALPEDFTAEAADLLQEWRKQNLQLMAPNWFASEVANILFQRLRAGVVSLDEAVASLQDLCAIVTLTDVAPGDAVRAIQLAHALAQPASYDAQYLVLAEREQCELWTADKRFWRAARRSYPLVRWIGEIAASS